VLDDGGRVIAHANLTTDDAIVDFVLEHTDTDGGIVGIDAPLVVRNATGFRKCETALQAIGIRAFPANRTRFFREDTYSGIRGEDIVERLNEHGFTLRAEIAQGQMQRSIIEVYPHALIKRTWGTIAPYKTGKSSVGADLSFGLMELQRLMLEHIDPLLYWERPPIDPGIVATLGPTALRRHGDLLDAALCAYLGYLSWYGGPERVEAVGNIADGFIMLPRLSDVTKAKTLTVRIGNRKIADALQTLAVEQSRSVDDIVNEALRNWLDHQEEVEDLAAIAEVEGETTIPWEQVQAEMRASRTEGNSA